MTSPKADRIHRWRFQQLGGFDQVRIESGEDIRHLPELDQKLWAALSCPTQGVEFDEHTLALLDTDGDGRIRVPEILAAVDWTCRVLKDPSDLLAGEAVLPLSAINPDTEEGDKVLRSARGILENLGKPDADRIGAEDTADTKKIFATARFNGDGVVPPAAAEDESLGKAIEDIIGCVGAVPDRSGADGLTAELCEQFFEQARAYVEWHAEAEADAGQVLPMGADTEAAANAFRAVKAKIDDFFTRTALAGFDPLAAAPLNPAEADYIAIAQTELSAATAELAKFPLARAAAERSLPLAAGTNPAWAEPLAQFRVKAVVPLLGERDELSFDQWQDLSVRFAAHDAWMDRMRGVPVHGLGIERVKALLADDSEGRIVALIVEDEKLKDAADAISSVDRLIYYHQHLYRLLHNFVSLQDFYTPEQTAIFQAGTLYLDGRSCQLCVEVTDVAKHAVMAALSGTYLAYCDCTARAGGDKKTIVAAFTDGDSDNLMVGRNGVFYDRKGRDWDATITRIIDQPISVRQAFWGPYKRIARMIAEQIAKFAGDRDKAIEAKSTQGVADLGTTADAGKAAAPAAPFDIGKFAGIFAAAGLAIGAIGTVLAAVLSGFLGLVWWQMPLAILGIILAISGPSMLIAYLKLRGRNLGPILDANGWAVNTLAKINVPFGTTLTQVATLPKGAQRSRRDPFAQKGQPWGLYLFLLILIAALAGAWRQGWLDPWLAQLSLPTMTEQSSEPQSEVPSKVDESVAPADAATEKAVEAGPAAAATAEPEPAQARAAPTEAEVVSAEPSGADADPVIAASSDTDAPTAEPIDAESSDENTAGSTDDADGNDESQR